jgi:hypothetical protein
MGGEKARYIPGSGSEPLAVNIFICLPKPRAYRELIWEIPD